MTSEQAARELRQLATNLSIIPTSRTGEAIRKAIEVLEDYAKQERHEEYVGDNYTG